jgi:ketosteroid isomerase-like protein
MRAEEDLFMSEPTDDSVQIRELIEIWAQAVQERNLDTIVAHHDSNILMFDVPIVQLKGIKAYAESWQQMFPWLGDAGKFELSNLEVTAGGDVAFASAIVHCAGTELQQKGDELTVRLTVGLKKLDGQWMVTHEHHSVTSVD